MDMERLVSVRDGVSRFCAFTWNSRLGVKEEEYRWWWCFWHPILGSSIFFLNYVTKCIDCVVNPVS
jgi:hypothetical protein